MKKKSEPIQKTKDNGDSAFHHGFFERTSEFFRELGDKISNFFIKIFIAVARFFRFASRFMAYGAFYAILFSALFMCIKWLALPAFVFLGHPFVGLGAAIFLFTSLFLLGISLYGIARYIDKNIHAAISIPYKRKALTKFIELMDKFDLNEGVQNITNQHSYYNELKRGLNDTLIRLSKENKYDKMKDITKVLDSIEKECKIYALSLKLLTIVDGATKNDIIRLRVTLLVYLKVAKQLEFSPQQVDNKCQDVLKKSLKAIAHASTEEDEADIWVGTFVKFVSKLTEKNESDDVIIEKIITLMHAVWKLIDTFYYSESEQMLSKSQFWSELNYLLTDAYQKNPGQDPKDARSTRMSENSEPVKFDYDEKGQLKIEEYSLGRPPIVPRKYNGQKNKATESAVNSVTRKTVSEEVKQGKRQTERLYTPVPANKVYRSSIWARLNPF